MPRDEPARDQVRGAATAELAGEVTTVEQIPRGVNALYRIDRAGRERAVLKTPLYASEGAFLAEPAVLSRIGRDMPVPVPDVLASVRADDGPLSAPFYVMEYLDGREVDDATGLRPEVRERLVREAGAHLAAIHEVPVPDDVASGGYGHLHLEDGRLTATPPFESWWGLFEAMVEDVCTSMLGNGPLADDEPRFGDLAPTVRESLAGSDTAVAASSPQPSFVVRDYRPANLVLAPAGNAESLVGGVLDLSGLVGDGLLDVARAEDALIDVPFGGTTEAESLRSAFRRAYAEHRERAWETVFDDRYPYYRLYARANRLKAFDFFVQFARKDDPDEVARGWRSFVADRLAEIREDQY